MPPRDRLTPPVLLALAASLPLLAGRAAASDSPTPAASSSSAPGPRVTPPAGWEEAPALRPLVAIPASSAPRKAVAAECCRKDQDCCVLQSEVNNVRPAQITQEFSVSAASLPHATLREAPADQPGIPGAPGLHMIDARGRPPPWPGGPKESLRMLPPGRFGQIAYNDASTPYFLDEPCQGQGFGIERTVTKRDGVPFVGKGQFLALAQGEGGKLVSDRVHGVFRDNKPDLLAQLWTHAEAAPIASDAMHAHIGQIVDETTSRFTPGERVFFTLPEVILAFHSTSVHLEGGFFPSRFSHAQAFTEYAIPLDATTGGMAIFDMRDTNCWFSRDLGKIRKAPFRVPVLLSVSRTAAEREPRVRVLVLTE